VAERRSLFKMMFPNAGGQKKTVTQVQMLSGYSPTFTPWNNKPYEAEAVRSAVDSIARNAAKLKAKHIRRYGKTIEHVGGQIEKLLATRPNPNMNAYDFYYKMITTLLIDNNAFAYPHWDGFNLVAIWPINCLFAEFVEDATKRLFLKFYFADGEQLVLHYPEVIHLRRHFYANDLLGEPNKPINATLSAMHTTNEGLAESVKMSGSLRGIIKYSGILNDTDLEKNRQRFIKEYMTIQNAGGIAALDAKADYQELKAEIKTINYSQMKELRDAVFRYYGTNENIVMSKYSEEEWNAFYESVIEPMALQMSLEFTTKLFTVRELGHGNEIVFEANRLQYASTQSKVNVVERMVPMGLLTINEAREIFNLAPVKDGDKRLVSLNYVQADKQNLYQLGEDGKDENGGDDDGGTDTDDQKGDKNSGTEGSAGDK
jgi:HK97 family phage portal protein